ACFTQSEKAGLQNAFVAEMLGDAYYNLGKFNNAADAFRICQHRDRDHPRVQSKLGLALVRCGKHSVGLALLRKALESSPSEAELHDRLLQALVSVDRIEEAAGVADAKLQALSVHGSVDFVRAAALWFQLGNLPRALAILQAGLHRYPQDHKLRDGVEQLAGCPST